MSELLTRKDTRNRFEKLVHLFIAKEFDNCYDGAIELINDLKTIPYDTVLLDWAMNFSVWVDKSHATLDLVANKAHYSFRIDLNERPNIALSYGCDYEQRIAYQDFFFHVFGDIIYDQIVKRII